MALWQRAWDIRIGTVRVVGGPGRPSLDAEFSIEKDNKKTPNKITLSVYNLTADHRRQIENVDNLTVQVIAGYEGNIDRLFLGTVHAAQSHRRRSKKSKRRDGVRSSVEDLDIVTLIEGQDGGSSYSTARVQKSYGDNTTFLRVIRDLITAMGIGEGNLQSAGVPSRIYPEGTVVSGRAWRELDRLVRSVGLTWSVQDGALQLLRGRTPLRQTAVRLTPETGLIGSPEKSTDGTVSLTALMIPGLTPGRQVVIESSQVSGSYRIRRVRYEGDTVGTAWYAHLVTEPF